MAMLSRKRPYPGNLVLERSDVTKSTAVSAGQNFKYSPLGYHRQTQYDARCES